MTEDHAEGTWTPRRGLPNLVSELQGDFPGTGDTSVEIRTTHRTSQNADSQALPLKILAQDVEGGENEPIPGDSQVWQRLG